MTDAEEINKEIIESHKDSPMIKDQIVLVQGDQDHKMVLDHRVDNITDLDLKDLDLKIVLDRMVVLDLKVAQDHRVDNITDLVQVAKILLATTHKKKDLEFEVFFFI
jgi:hypothetical protein